LPLLGNDDRTANPAHALSEPISRQLIQACKLRESAFR
jgi:hypothetical protein